MNRERIGGCCFSGELQLEILRAERGHLGHPMRFSAQGIIRKQAAVFKWLNDALLGAVKAFIAVQLGIRAVRAGRRNILPEQRFAKHEIVPFQWAQKLRRKSILLYIFCMAS